MSASHIEVIKNICFLDNIAFCVRFKWERAVNFQKQILDKIEVKLKVFDDMSITGVLKRRQLI